MGKHLHVYVDDKKKMIHTLYSLNTFKSFFHNLKVVALSVSSLSSDLWVTSLTKGPKGQCL